MARILIVEPNGRLRAFVAGILADFGHEVCECATADEAQSCLDRGEFDVLTADLLLRDGARGIAQLADRLPAMTLSGQLFAAIDAGRQLPAPLRDKPFRFADLDALLAAVDRCADNGRAGGA